MADSTVPLIIDNKDLTTQITFDVINPSNGKVQHQSSSASVTEATLAAESAQRAFKLWSKTKPSARRDVLLKTADIFLERKEELIRYMQEETGAERAFAEFQLISGSNLIKDAAGKISSITGSIPTLVGEGDHGFVYKEPYGGVLAIAPWNGPYILGVRNVVLALAAGNTVILKGSEMAPRSFWAIGDVFRQASVPAGCLNVLYHRPQDAAQVTGALIAHPAIQKIGFTGSTIVGKIVASVAGQHAKPVILELGGKSSCIILDDADVKKAAMGCTLGSFLNAGQVCMSTERIIVQRSIVEEFRAAFTSTVESTYGASQPAPVLINQGAVVKSQSLVQDALSKGAKVIMGDLGEEVVSTSMRPIVIGEVTKEMDIYKTESFGPTVSLFVVDDDDEAVALANDTEYGLTAALYTKNLGRALKLAQDIESGAVHINCMTIHDEVALPHGGVKQSGFGRFGGVNSLDEFLKLKSVTWRD